MQVTTIGTLLPQEGPEVEQGTGRQISACFSGSGDTLAILGDLKEIHVINYRAMQAGCGSAASLHSTLSICMVQARDLSG